MFIPQYLDKIPTAEYLRVGSIDTAFGYLVDSLPTAFILGGITYSNFNYPIVTALLERYPEIIIDLVAKGYDVRRTEDGGQVEIRVQMK